MCIRGSVGVYTNIPGRHQVGSSTCTGEVVRVRGDAQVQLSTLCLKQGQTSTSGPCWWWYGERQVRSQVGLNMCTYGTMCKKRLYCAPLRKNSGESPRS